MQGLHGFILSSTFLNFLDFHEKVLVKKETKTVLTNKKNPKHI